MMEKIKNFFKNGFLTGHLSLGCLTVFGRNAMHWGVTFKTKKYGYVCFRLPLPCFGRWWKLYWYCSPNATPWAATFMLGGNRDDWVKSRIRYTCFGHNFDVHGYNAEYEMENYAILRGINNLVYPYPHPYATYATKQGYNREEN